MKFLKNTSKLYFIDIWPVVLFVIICTRTHCPHLCFKWTKSNICNKLLSVLVSNKLVLSFLNMEQSSTSPPHLCISIWRPTFYPEWKSMQTCNGHGWINVARIYTNVTPDMNPGVSERTHANTFMFKVTFRTFKHAIWQRAACAEKEMWAPNAACISCTFRTFLSPWLSLGQDICLAVDPHADRVWLTSQNRTITARSSEGPSSQPPPDTIKHTHTQSEPCTQTSGPESGSSQAETYIMTENGGIKAICLI